MKPQLYRAITSGDPIMLRSKLGIFSDLSLVDQRLSPHGHTLLHLAATLGHHHLFDLLLHHCPELFHTRNCDGDIALHLAAASGNRDTLLSLISHAKHLQTRTHQDLLMEENSYKDTALHVALKCHHYGLAVLLVEMNPQVCTRLNAQNMSPLCMAAEAGQLELVEVMMEKGTVDITILEGKSVVHAALKARNREVLDAVLKDQSTYFCPWDGYGRSPLSYASSIGYLDGVNYYLGKSSCVAAAYIRDRDKDGSFPIHWASMRGHINIIEQLLRRWPDSKELVNNDGHNILHVAAKKGKANVVSYMLKIPELEMLINQRDKKDGKTPLHLATEWEHARVVHILTWDKRVKLQITNDRGLTALEAAEENPWNSTFQKRLLCAALRYAGAPSTHQENKTTTEDDRNHRCSERINTLLLVALLIAIVTFVARLTMPGGYNNSDNYQYQGMATLVKKPMFQFFQISNTIAMCSSILAAILLIWAMLNDLRLRLYSLKFAIPLLGISLSLASLASIAAIFLLMNNVIWLAALILLIGSISVLGLWLLFVPLSFPLSLKYTVSRYILCYPLYLLILATERKEILKMDAEV